jgi:hypothetical protein
MGKPGHELFEIEVPKVWWITMITICTLAEIVSSFCVLKTIATSQGLPFPMPNLPFLQPYKMM